MADLTSPWLIRGLAAVGAVVVLGGISYVLANVSTSAQHSHLGTAQRAPSASSPAAGKKYQGLNFGVRRLNYNRGGTRANFPALTTAADVTRASLASNVRTQIADSKVPSLPSATTGSAPSAEKRVGPITITQLVACVTRIASRRDVLLAEVAHYDGSPAMILVFRPLSPSPVFDVVITALSCSASNGHIITRTTVPTS